MNSSGKSELRVKIKILLSLIGYFRVNFWFGKIAYYTDVLSFINELIW